MSSVYANQVTILVNNKPIDQLTYTLKVGDKISTTCTSDIPEANVSVMSFGGGTKFSRILKGEATLEQTITKEDAAFRGKFELTCFACREGFESGGQKTVSLKIEFIEEKKDPNPPKLTIMKLLVNDKPVDQSTYTLKIGDKIRFTCASDKPGADISILSLGKSGMHYSDNPKDNVSLEQVIRKEDGTDGGRFDLICFARNKGFKSGDQKYVSLKVEGEDKKIDTHPPKIKNMEIRVNTVPADRRSDPAAGAAVR